MLYVVFTALIINVDGLVYGGRPRRSNQQGPSLQCVRIFISHGVSTTAKESPQAPHLTLDTTFEPSNVPLLFVGNTGYQSRQMRWKNMVVETGHSNRFARFVDRVRLTSFKINT